ncbi:MAG: hypothetical protein M0D57_08280 [Sphingobacteriales bacterium JAD_PAG50586_3]|nr:MAG: hypothetical protein M0D57_08280 [Sphingobacteriales bacterium JAD_PAG50586_3]
MTGDEVNDGEGEAGLNSFPGYGQIPKQVRDDGTDRGFILQIFLTAAMDEEAYLKPSKTKIREQKMIAAESMRKDGMLIDNIAIELDVPEGTVKRWVAGVEPLPVDKTPRPPGTPS